MTALSRLIVLGTFTVLASCGGASAGPAPETSPEASTCPPHTDPNEFMLHLVALAEHDDMQGFVCQLSAARRQSWYTNADFHWQVWRDGLLRLGSFARGECVLSANRIHCGELSVIVVMEEGGFRVDEN